MIQTRQPDRMAKRGPIAAPAFYVVLNSLMKNCTVVDRMPQTDTPNFTVASDMVRGPKPKRHWRP